jgi:hypothetical protein
VVWWAGNNSVLSDPVHSVDSIIVQLLGGDKIYRFLVKVTFFLFLFSFIEFLISGQEILRNLMNQHIACVGNSTEVPIIQWIDRHAQNRSVDFSWGQKFKWNFGVLCNSDTADPDLFIESTWNHVISVFLFGRKELDWLDTVFVDVDFE